MKSQKIYIIGIEGAGTSALAEILVARGAVVSGSDDGDGFYRENLRKLGIEVYESFDVAHIPSDVDLAVHSTAFGEDNVEIAEIKKKGIKLLSYPEAVAEIFNNFKMPVAICGTHGKTTTTAMMAEVLRSCGGDPVALVGSQIVGWGGNALTGNGEIMVLEADEYQNKLRYYNPQVVVLTGVDYDHPDFFPTPESYEQVFSDFLVRIPADGLLVVCGDNPRARKIAQTAQIKCQVIYYGFSEDNDVVIKDYTSKIVNDLPVNEFKIYSKTVSIRLPGKHNTLNATASYLVAQRLDDKELFLDASDKAVTMALAQFRGARRRFEYHSTYNKAVLIDDYAHHPAEVVTTLTAVRKLYPQKNIIAAFHPHTFTRTRALLDEFAQSFGEVDKVIVIDIYGSARETQGGVHARDLVDAINEKSDKQKKDKAIYIGEIPDLATWARENLRKNDVFITLGAGDIWKAHNLIKG